MIKSLEKSGRSVEEALKAALAELGLDEDDVSYSYEVVTRPKSGFLGIGAVPAVVRVNYETKDEPAVEAPKQEAKAAAAPKTAKKPAPVKEEKKAEPAPAPVKAEQPAPVVDENADYAAIRSFLTGLLERMNVKADIEIGPRDNGGINVNLSILECMKDGFADHMNEIVEDAGIRKKFINFEITESVAAKDYDHLSGVIDQLKNEGFLFSIDDYGTGYSNMTALFSLGADVIKIDKSILWNAEKSDLGMTLLKTSVDMVHEMHKKSLMEGVETEAQIEILKKLGCNYLQGYYFSKPVPKDEFIRLIEQQQAVI